MSLKPLFAALTLVGLSSLASANVSQNNGPYTLTYDETTGFGRLSSWFSSDPRHGFSWTVPNSVQVASFGPLQTASFDLPSFTVTANAGWSLSSPAGFLGNISWVQVGDATTNIQVYADIALDGGPVVSINGTAMGWVVTAAGPSFSQGYFADTGKLSGPFSSLTVSNASIVLSATGGSFSSIGAQPQNKLEISFAVAQVPEPETAAMLLAGLAALGLLAHRRGRQG